MDDDPKLILSRHNQMFSRNGVTVEVNLCRLEDTKWSLEVIDKDHTSIVWDGQFDSDDEAYAEFLRSVETEGLDGILRDPNRLLLVSLSHRVPPRGDDEPETISYAISSNCPAGPDGEQGDAKYILSSTIKDDSLDLFS